MYKTVLTRFVIFFVLFLLIPTSFLFAQDQLFLLRHVTNIRPLSDDLTTNATSATYKPIFGAGDRDAEKLKGIVRYGELTVDPGGTSAIISYPAEEQIYYILEGKGTLLYDGQKVPVKKNDYMYVPVGVKHGILNSSDQPVRLLVMGYRIPSGTEVPPTPKLMMASADDMNLHT